MGLEWNVRVKSINVLLISGSTVNYSSVQIKKNKKFLFWLHLSYFFNPSSPTTCLHYGIDISFYYLIKIQMMKSILVSDI